ncbi:16197_t:CDS:2, partial [Acaulospora morrowiae]
FIFEFNPRNSLDYREFLEIPALMFLLLAGTVALESSMSLNPVSVYYPHILGAIFLSITFLPFNIFYYDARRWLMDALKRIVLAPLFRIEFRDFFVADGLNSLTFSMVNSQLLWRPFLHNIGCFGDNCVSTSQFIYTPLIAMLPPLWRLLQCFRRYHDTGRAYIHLVNAGKYFSTIILVYLSFLWHINEKSIGLFASFIGIQIITSVYTFLWDVCMDWSLFMLNSPNFLLRDELAFKHHSFYYFAIILNLFLRFSWILNLTLPVEYTDKITMAYIIAFGEIFRRWQWIIIRVENE